MEYRISLFFQLHHIIPFADDTRYPFWNFGDRPVWTLGRVRWVRCDSAAVLVQAVRANPEARGH